jgi:hypothetical protein
MPIQTGAKGATIQGVAYPPYFYIDWLAPDQEALAVQGGDTVYVPSRSLTPNEVAALKAQLQAAPFSSAGTWAEMRARAAVDRETWLLTDTVMRPEWWQYNAAAARWYPIGGRARLVNRGGSVATPLATLTGVTAGLFALDPMVLPAGFLAVGAQVRAHGLFRRSGATGTGTVRARLGTGGNTSDAILVSQSMAATDALTYRMYTEGRVINANTLLSAGSNAVNGTTAGGVLDVTGQVDIEQPMSFTLGIASANAADTFAVLAIAIDVEF